MLSIRLTISIILFVVGMAFAQPTLFDKKVLDARKAMEKYRQGYGATPKQHNIHFGTLLDELEVAGYTEMPLDRIEAFLYDNKEYNMKALGFNDAEDFRKNASMANVADYLDSWR